jgi:hypothetical protein
MRFRPRWPEILPSGRFGGGRWLNAGSGGLNGGFGWLHGWKCGFERGDGRLQRWGGWLGLAVVGTGCCWGLSSTGGSSGWRHSRRQSATRSDRRSTLTFQSFTWGRRRSIRRQKPNSHCFAPSWGLRSSTPTRARRATLTCYSRRRFQRVCHASWQSCVGEVSIGGKSRGTRHGPRAGN